MHTRLSFLTAGLMLSAALFSGCSSPGQLGNSVSDNALRRAGGSPDPTQPIREAMTFATTFDHGLDADFALGDAKLYSASDKGGQAQAIPGLPPGDIVKRVDNAGLFGAALEFTKKSDAVVFYQGNTNLAYRTNWSGTASFWLKVDPEKDLAEGYSHPLQFAGQKPEDGTVQVEFSKNLTPRYFRFAFLGRKHLWNPENFSWEEMPPNSRPMVQVEKAPFSRDRWTHVVITFKYANTGRKDGIAKLYIDGELQGSLAGFENTLGWDAVQNYLNLGRSYTGLIDEVSVYNRALSANEVQVLHHLPHGLLDLLYRDSGYVLIGQRKWLTKDNHLK